MVYAYRSYSLCEATEVTTDPSEPLRFSTKYTFWHLHSMVRTTQDGLLGENHWHSTPGDGHSVACAAWGRMLTMRMLRQRFTTKGGSSSSVKLTPRSSGWLSVLQSDSSDTRKQIPLSIQKRDDLYGVVGKAELGK